ncbi:MAG: rod shape-determining protein MreC [Solirubrobacterales bacterium]
MSGESLQTPQGIAQSPTAWYSTVTVDQGRSRGIEVGDPVITGDGLAGQVTTVTGHASRRSSWLEASRSARRPLALRVSPVHPTRSRAGLRTREAPSWIGARTSSAPRCSECRPPPEPSPK